MGRFSIETSVNNTQTTNQNTQPGNWPTTFLKQTIGIDRNGVITQNKPIRTPQDLEIIPGSLEGIRQLRLKGYKVFLFFNEPLIGSGELKQENVDEINQEMMKIFGQAGIFSIEGLLYSTTNLKNDIYSMPNTGMLKKAEREFKQNFKQGFFAGNNIRALKAGDAAGAQPIFIKTGEWTETEIKLDTFANKTLKSRTRVFSTLLDFANSLP